jgi:hypothetical protein
LTLDACASGLDACCLFLSELGAWSLTLGASESRQVYVKIICDPDFLSACHS